MGSHVAAKRTKRPRDRDTLADEFRDCWAMLRDAAALWGTGTILAAKSVAAEWKDWPHGPSTD